MAENDQAKPSAASREAAEQRLQEAWLKGKAFDDRMQQLNRDEPRAPRAAEQRRGRR